MGKIETIIVDDESLDASSTDNLFEKINTLPQDDLSAIEINLKKVKFVDPYGLVALCLVGRHLKNRCHDISISLPDCAECQSYLYSMNFVSVMEKLSNVKNIASNLAPGQSINHDVVIELTKIEKKSTESNKDIGDVLNRLDALLRNQLNYGDKEISSLSNIISELCYNIKDHSEDEGFVAVQRYQRKADGKRYVVIGVGDLGVGIRASLGHRIDISTLNHLDAIIHALKKDTSAYPERGLGLYMVSKITKDYAGTLHIRSGNARLHLRHNPRGIETANFPGTQVSISLSEIEKNS
jgi:ABC-type transporter Mla MlaB component/anti-sigma regulatory factor (Ser/Thr protein kinase)